MRDEIEEIRSTMAA